MADGQSGKTESKPPIGSPHQNQVHPYDGQDPPPGYSGPQFSGGQPGPITSQPGAGQSFGYHSTSNTTVVVTQQQQVPTRPPKRGWSTGICGCFEDFGSCCAVILCPSCYVCYLSNKLGESCCLPFAIAGHGALIPLRTKIRAENNIHGSICEDCCMVLWCSQCVMCQLSREYDNIQLNQELTIR
ncbi:cornifelin homolog isoform X2 [Saccostrea cucullata]|uniref:cornifelin homolog isoform X2 n=1 Tax=Saccostrea cuccullata TaxID=36930 RepID=UPI002ED3E69A